DRTGRRRDPSERRWNRRDHQRDVSDGPGGQHDRRLPRGQGLPRHDDHRGAQRRDRPPGDLCRHRHALRRPDRDGPRGRWRL
ncbi:MAG: hypothetical protein AVDCRST_MAG33-329, partial [uncultured Thermomicrobiales bacterium]